MLHLHLFSFRGGAVQRITPLVGHLISNFPRRARNTNSGNPILAHDTEADICVATNTVHYDNATPSFVEMLVLTP